MILIYTSVVFALAVALHAGVCRMRLKASALVRFLAIGSVAGLAWAWELHRLGRSGLEIGGSLSVYAFLCEFYLFAFNMAMTSISANLLVTLLHSPLAAADLAARYDSRAMVGKRLHRLQAAGLLASAQGRLESTVSGHRLTARFSKLRRFFGHRD